jgi:hypothetical protein
MVMALTAAVSFALRGLFESLVQVDDVGSQDAGLGVADGSRDTLSLAGHFSLLTKRLQLTANFTS